MPNKPLQMAGDLTVLGWTYNQVKQCPAIDMVIVTSPDREIAQHCQSLRIPFFPSSQECQNGTQRCAEVFQRMDVSKRMVIDVILNVQCDEPDIDPQDLFSLVHVTREFPKWISTLVASWGEEDNKDNPNIVKTVVSTFNSQCHWFTRQNIPGSSQHVGVYGFSPGVLSAIGKFEPSFHSRNENLEQLTWLEEGLVIKGVYCLDDAPISINVPKDLKRFQEKIRKGGVSVDHVD